MSNGNKTAPTKFDSKRAKAIYAQRGPFFDFKCTDMTPGEDAYVSAVYAKLDGSASWATAFYRIMSGRNVPTV